MLLCCVVQTIRTKMQNSEDVFLGLGEGKEEIFSKVYESTAAKFSCTVGQLGQFYRNFENYEKIRLILGFNMQNATPVLLIRTS